MRATIKRRGPRLDLSFDGLDGRVTRTFYSNGTYVFEAMPNGRDVQVCDGLSYRGNTLMATHDQLLDVIRREHKRREARNKRALKL